MSTVLEVSEGFAPDRAPFQPPTQSEDASKPRYLAFLGNLIDAQRMAEKPISRPAGGIEMGSPCLRMVRGIIRKGRITPLVKDINDWQNEEKVRKIVDGDPLQRGYFSQQRPVGYTPPLMETRDGNLVPSKIPKLVTTLALPGLQINSLLGDAQRNLLGLPFGITEIRSLAGQDYNPVQMANGMFIDPNFYEMNLAIFPEYPNLPVLIRDVERLLDKAKVHTMLRPIVDDMGNSLRQFSNYATAAVQQAHVRMKAVAQAGEVPSYTEMDLVLLEQLGVAREDQALFESARQEKSGGNEKLESMFEQWLAISLEEKKAAMEREQRLSEIGQAPIVEGQDGYPGQSGYSGYSGNIQASAEIEKIPCPDCGHLVTPKGMSFHQRRWCKGKDANV